MSERTLSRRTLLRGAMALGASTAFTACQPKIVEVTKVVEKEVEKIVKETVVVKEAVEVEKEVTRVVSQQAPAPESGQVTVVYHCRAGAVEAPASEYPTHQNRLSEFREEHPEIDVKREGIAGTNEEYYVKLATMYVGGTLGDMTFTSQTYSQHLKLAYDGVLAACDEFMARDGISEDEWYPAAMAGSKLDGKLYGLPMCLHPGGHAFVIYNENKFQEAGLKEPDGKTYTVEDMREAANKLSVGDPGARSVYGFRPNFAGIQCHEGWMRTFGANSFIDETGTKSLMNTPEALEWAKYAYALYNEDKVAPRAESLPSGGILAMFAAGNLASFQSGTWDLLNSINLVAGEFKVGLNLAPIGAGGYGACGYLNSFAPTSTSKNPSEAWTLTYAFCDQRCGYLQLKLAASLPGRSDVFDFPDIQSSPVYMVERDSMMQVANQYYMENFAAIEHQQALNAAMDLIILGEEEPTQAYMNSVHETLQKIINKPR